MPSGPPSVAGAAAVPREAGPPAVAATLARVERAFGDRPADHPLERPVGRRERRRASKSDEAAVGPDSVAALAPEGEEAGEVEGLRGGWEAEATDEEDQGEAADETGTEPYSPEIVDAGSVDNEPMGEDSPPRATANSSYNSSPLQEASLAGDEDFLRVAQMGTPCFGRAFRDDDTDSPAGRRRSHGSRGSATLDSGGPGASPSDSDAPHFGGSSVNSAGRKPLGVVDEEPDGDGQPPFGMSFGLADYFAEQQSAHQEGPAEAARYAESLGPPSPESGLSRSTGAEVSLSPKAQAIGEIRDRAHRLRQENNELLAMAGSVAESSDSEPSRSLRVVYPAWPQHSVNARRLSALSGSSVDVSYAHHSPKYLSPKYNSLEYHSHLVYPSGKSSPTYPSYPPVEERYASSPAAVDQVERDFSSARIAALAHDLRKAILRAIEKRREIETRHAEAVESHDRRMGVLLDEYDDTEQEINYAASRNARELEINENDQLDHVYRMQEHRAEAQERQVDMWDRGARHATHADLLKEVREERAERDAGHRRAVELREELRGVDAVVADLAEKQQEHRKQQIARATMAGPLKYLSGEIATLRARLQLTENGEDETDAENDGLPPSVVLEATARLVAGAAQFELEVAGARRDLVVRQHVLEDGELRLELERRKARERSSEVAAAVRQAERGREVCKEIESRSEEFETEEIVLLACNRPLTQEVEAITERYERQKQKLFAYAAALDRGGPPFADENATASTASGAGRPGSGISALIRALARQYGSAEVAFLSLDARGAGKITREEFELGLLLNMRLDYLALTGLSLRAIFNAIDRQSQGGITAADLADCCPGEWTEHGMREPTAREKLRALPWREAGVKLRALAGGAVSAFDAALASGGAGANDGLQWPQFCDLLCQQMYGFSEDEAYDLFAELADANGTISRSRWRKATAPRA